MMRVLQFWLTTMIFLITGKVYFSSKCQNRVETLYLADSVDKNDNSKNQEPQIHFSVLNSQRKQHLNNYCNNLTHDDLTLYNYYVNQKTIKENQFRGSRMPFRLDTQHKLIWCKIPKAGSTTWSLIFEKLQGLEISTKDKGPKMWNEIQRVLKVASENQIVQINRLILKEFRSDSLTNKIHGYSSILVVRHPINRLFSAFQEKIVQRTETFLPGVNDKHSLSLTPDGQPTFSSFLQYITSEEKSFNEHWFPMFGLCDPCHISFDYILKMENLDLESRQLLNMLRLSDKAQVEHMNQSKKSLQSQKDKEYYRKLITGTSFEVLQKLLHIVRLDFEIFDYDISIFEDLLTEKTLEDKK